MTVKCCKRKNLDGLCVETLPDLIDPEKLRYFYMTVFHKLEAKCSHCDEPLKGKAQRSWLAGKRTRCASCGARVMIWQKTPLHAIKASEIEFFIFSYLVGCGTESKNIREALGIRADTEKNWRNRLENMSTRCCGDGPCSGSCRCNLPAGGPLFCGVEL